MNQIKCELCSEHITKYRKGQRFCSRSCSLKYKVLFSGLDDPDFFSDDSVTDEFKSYYAGFFYADGCYSKSNGLDRITLSMNDKEMIESMAEIICPSRKIYVQKSKKIEHAEGYSIINRNPNVINQFKNWGITYRKSLSLSLPKNFQYDIRHFIRGLFDGDGSVYNSSVFKDKIYKGVSITTGSEVFSHEIVELMSNYNINFQVNKDSRHQAYYLRLNKQKEISKLKHFMYDDSKWYLQRKFVKFDDIV